MDADTDHLLVILPVPDHCVVEHLPFLAVEGPNISTGKKRTVIAPFEFSVRLRVQCRMPGLSPRTYHKHGQAVFQVSFDSTPSPNTQVLLPSGIIVMGVDDWVTKLADVA